MSYRLRVSTSGLVMLMSAVTGCGSDDGADTQSREIAASEATSTSEVARGQWVKWRIEYQDDTTITLAARAKEKEGEYTWFDFDQRSDTYGNLDLRVLGTPGTLENPVGFIKEVEGSADTGNELADEYLSEWMLTDAAKEIMTVMAQVRFSDMANEESPVVVQAGTFHGCYKETQYVNNTDDEVEVTVWRHPDVPFSGFVLATDAAKTYRMELVDFGQN